MRSTLPQSTPVRDRAGTGVNGNDLRKYSRCSMEMKFVTNAETLTPPVQRRRFLDPYHLAFQVTMDSGCNLPSNALVGVGHDKRFGVRL